MNRTVRIALVVIVAVALVILIMASYIIASISSLNLNGAHRIAGSIAGNISVEKNNLLTYNNSQDLVDYALLGYRLANVTGINASLSLYTRRPVERIYLVDTLIGAVNYCVQCFQNAALSSSLRSALGGRGLLLNNTSFRTVNLENMSSIPAGSIVIIASGLIPASLLPSSSYAGSSLTGNETLLDMLAKGDYVIFAGRNFSTSVGVGDDIFITPPKTLAILNNSSVLTLPFSGNITNVTAPSMQFKSPTFRFFRGAVFENVTSVNIGNGTIIAMSNYPAAGWKNVSSFSQDIATVIDSRFWINRIAYGYAQMNITNAIAFGSLPVVTLLQQINYSINITQSVNRQLRNSYALVRVYVYNPTAYAESQIQFSPTFLNQGEVSMPGEFGETQTLPVTVASANGLNQQTSFHLTIVNLSSDSFGSLPIGFYGKPFTIIHYYSFTIPSGYYIAELQDLNSLTYTASLFHVSNVTIEPMLLDFKNSSFEFRVLSNHLLLYNVSYTVSIDGAYPQSGYTQNGTISYTLPAGAVEQYGAKNFEFGMFGTTYVYQSGYIQPAGITIPPLYIEFGISAAVILLLNVILKAPTQDDYFIDVPNLPPTKKVKLKTDKGSVLSIFDTVNYSYHWKYMPLTAEEIKAGISTNIRYENVPIAVTLQNTNAVLNRLVSSGALVMSSYHYAPSRWIAESHHDIEYLTIFRKLRDYCVSNAMLFTDLDAEGHVDMIITKRGAQAHVVIYSSISGMKDLALNNAYRIYVVFLSEVQRLDFLGELYNSYGEEAELLKMGIEYSYIMLIDTDHMDQLII